MVETALRVAHRAPGRMQSLRLAVSAGKLDVCNLTNHLTGAGRGQITNSPGEVASWGGHWELVCKTVPTGTKCRRNHELNKKQNQGFLGAGRQSVGAAPDLAKRQVRLGRAPARQGPSPQSVTSSSFDDLVKYFPWGSPERIC